MPSLLPQRFELLETIDKAVWSGDTQTLYQVARCKCCCDEHTFYDCPARLWFGCRGQGVDDAAEQESWVRHYERFHGMTREQFFA